MDKIALQIELVIATNKVMEFVVKRLQVSAKDMENVLKSYQHYKETSEMPTTQEFETTVSATFSEEERASIGYIFLTILHMYIYGDEEIVPLATQLMEALWQLVRMYEPLDKTKCPDAIEKAYGDVPQSIKDRFTQELLSLESLKNAIYN